QGSCCLKSGSKLVFKTQFNTHLFFGYICNGLCNKCISVRLSAVKHSFSKEERCFGCIIYVRIKARKPGFKQRSSYNITYIATVYTLTINTFHYIIVKSCVRKGISKGRGFCHI